MAALEANKHYQSASLETPVPYPHIALLTVSLRPGGTERQVVNLARWLSQSGRFRVSVVTIFPGRTPLTEELQQAGIPVYSDWFSGAFGRSLGILRLAQFLRAQRVKVVHVFLLAAAPLGIPGAVLGGVRARVVSERSATRPIWPKKRAWIYRLLLPFVHRIETNSAAARQILIEDEHIHAAKIIVHRNSIELKYFDPLPAPPDELWARPERIRVGTVANIHPFKNPLLFAQVMHDLIMDYPTLDAVHVGRVMDESLAARVERHVQEDIGERWIALGGRDDVPSVLRTFEIFVLTSDMEGTSNAILEAMACGLPVVTTDTGDARAILAESGGGIVVPVGDRPALSAALRNLLEKPELRQRMGESNRRWVFANCHPGRLTHQVEAMYDQLLADHS